MSRVSKSETSISNHKILELMTKISCLSTWNPTLTKYFSPLICHYNPPPPPPTGKIICQLFANLGYQWWTGLERRESEIKCVWEKNNLTPLLLFIRKHWLPYNPWSAQGIGTARAPDPDPNHPDLLEDLSPSCWSIFLTHLQPAPDHQHWKFLPFWRGSQQFRSVSWIRYSLLWYI